MAATTIAPHSHGQGPIPDQSRADRRASFDLGDFPVPSGREEDWRFTPLPRLRGLHEGAGHPGGKVLVEVSAPGQAVVECVDRHDVRLGTVGTPGRHDGNLRPLEKRIQKAPEAISQYLIGCRFGSPSIPLPHVYMRHAVPRHHNN